MHEGYRSMILALALSSALRRALLTGSPSNAIDSTTQSRIFFRCCAATFSGVSYFLRHSWSRLLACSRSIGSCRFLTKPIFPSHRSRAAKIQEAAHGRMARSILEKSPSVGMTNRQRPPLLEAQTDPTARLSSAPSYKCLPLYSTTIVRPSVN